jgi:hypothetical protein
MNKQSVENNITLQPHVPFTFFWSGDTLSIIPANSLQQDTTYTVTIGDETMTTDSVPFRCPFSFFVTTSSSTFFSDYWPLDSAKNINRVIPFTYKSPYTLEAAPLRDAFSIIPAVDSLEFTATQSGMVEVRHAALDPDTTYQITVNGSLMSRKGTLLGEDLIIIFSTAGN